jgi:hypothetical protein
MLSNHWIIELAIVGAMDFGKTLEILADELPVSFGALLAHSLQQFFPHARLHLQEHGPCGGIQLAKLLLDLLFVKPRAPSAEGRMGPAARPLGRARRCVLPFTAGSRLGSPQALGHRHRPLQRRRLHEL